MLLPCLIKKYITMADGYKFNIICNMDIEKLERANKLYSELKQIDEFLKLFVGQDMVISIPVRFVRHELTLNGKRKNDMIEVLKSWREECIKEIESM